LKSNSVNPLSSGALNFLTWGLEDPASTFSGVSPAAPAAAVILRTSRLLGWDSDFLEPLIFSSIMAHDWVQVKLHPNEIAGTADTTSNTPQDGLLHDSKQNKQ
jgi:hypothetical protein